MEVTYSGGILSLIIDSEVPVNRLVVGKEGSVLKQENETVAWEDGLIIESSMTLNIPTDYATIEDAFKFLANKKIKSDAIVTIRFADGTYNRTSPISPTHPDGRNIKIIGNLSSPGNVIINCTDGGVAISGSSIRLIDGITFDGGGNTKSGIYVSRGGVARLGSSLVSQNFEKGITVSLNGLVIANGVTVNNTNDVGVRVERNGFLRIENSQISNTASYDFYVLRGGYIESKNNSVSSYGSYAYFIGSQSLLDLSGGTNDAVLSNRSLDTEIPDNSYIRSF
jgi:hypothetical protein